MINSRKLNNWGGVAVYVRPGLTFVHRTDIEVFDEGVFESVFIEILDKRESYIVRVIYCPPGSDMAKFFDYMDNVFDKVSGKRLYLMGL